MLEVKVSCKCFRHHEVEVSNASMISEASDECGCGVLGPDFDLLVSQRSAVNLA
jgi:hypothetical protein